MAKSASLVAALTTRKRRSPRCVRRVTIRSSWMPPLIRRARRIALLVPGAAPRCRAATERSSARGGIGAAQDRLPHMRDIEQARFRAGVEMLLDDAGADSAPAWHSPRMAQSGRRARGANREEACGRGEAPRRLDQQTSVLSVGWTQRRRSTERNALPPLSCDLRVFSRTAATPGRKLNGTTSVGGFPALAKNRFPERHLPAVHGPERFRGGSPSASIRRTFRSNSSAEIILTYQLLGALPAMSMPSRNIPSLDGGISTGNP